MKSVSDVMLNFLVKKMKILIDKKMDNERIQIVTELPEDALDGTIFLLIPKGDE